MESNWSLSQESLNSIANECRKLNKLNYILELGCGSSSYFLAETFPNTKIISIEHDRSYFQKYCKANVFENLKIIHAELEFQLFESFYYLTYNPLFLEALSGVGLDAILIDGPPFYTLRGRECCLYHLYSRLKVGGLVILDDVLRFNEQHILANWFSVYPDSFEVKYLKVGQHLVVLEKMVEVQPSWDAKVRCDDAFKVNSFYKNMAFALQNLSPLSINHEYYDLISMMKEYFLTFPLVKHHRIQDYSQQELIDMFLKILQMT